MSTVPIGKRPRHRSPVPEEIDDDVDDERADRGLLPVGALVGGYRVERPLADGGMATVYDAVHTVLPRRAAIKVLHRHLLGKWAARERLFQEARILEALQHPGIVKIYDAGVLDDDRPWIAMELVEGPTVAERLTLHRRLDAIEVIDLLDHTVAALEAAHKNGVIHRDLKPENIILCRSPSGIAVRVVDWGIARVLGEQNGRLTRANMTPGTPLYMSPEQARGKPVDGRSDIYTLGVIACEALTGVPPFVGESPLDVVVQHLTAEPPSLRSRRPELPESLERLVLEMLAKEACDRPSIATIRARLAEIAVELRDAAYEDLSIEMEIDLDDPPEPAPLPRRLARPRWTPPIVPTSPRAAVAGEIVPPAGPRARNRQAGKAETLALVISTLLTALMLAAALALPAFQLGRPPVRSLSTAASHAGALDRHTERVEPAVDLAKRPTSQRIGVAHRLQ